MGWEASHENGISMNFAIIAAGEGSRLAQEGVKWPKPLVRLHGVALVDRLMEVFVRQGATSISIIVNETMTEVQEACTPNATARSFAPAGEIDTQFDA